MRPRDAIVERSTRETTVRVELRLDGSGAAAADTGLPFFDHMLEQLGTHAGFDLSVTAKGDLEVDGHHTVEDVGLALGQALAEALGDKGGIRRFASITVPLDEAAVEVALDSPAGRSSCTTSTSPRRPSGPTTRGSRRTSSGPSPPRRR